MAITLYHHPFSRAANVIWMLEEVGAPYEIQHVDIMKGAQKSSEVLALNPMGKLPILTDGDAVVTESAAIGLYLADRHAYGRLAPHIDEPTRATYLRWSLFAPSVIEPGLMAKASDWSFKESQAGWGSYEAMISAMENAVTDRAFILGDTFSMADVIFGGTLRYMLMVKMLDPRPAFTAYAERLAARPALQRADARNAARRAGPEQALIRALAPSARGLETCTRANTARAAEMRHAGGGAKHLSRGQGVTGAGGPLAS